MKAIIFAAAQIVLVGMNAYAQGTRESANSGQQRVGTAQAPSNSVQSNPSAQEVLEFLSQRPSASATSPVVAPAPAARIRVVAPDSATRPASSARGPRAAASIPTARIRVVDDAIVGKTKIEAPLDAEPAAANAAAEAAVIAATTRDETAALDPALARLVGTWKAVARTGDGELTTVELQLDDRGWAKFTVPGADGKPSTIKRRAELNGEDLNLSGSDANLLLGKLIEVNDRQMVLARAEGKLTFVRPR